MESKKQVEKKTITIRLRITPELNLKIRSRAGYLTKGNISEFIRIAVEQLKLKK